MSPRNPHLQGQANEAVLSVQLDRAIIPHKGVPAFIVYEDQSSAAHLVKPPGFRPRFEAASPRGLIIFGPSKSPPNCAY